jgi:hypothetical protein
MVVYDTSVPLLLDHTLLQWKSGLIKSNYFILTIVVFTDKLLPGSDNIAIDLSKGIIIETWAMLNKYSHLLNLFLIAQGEWMLNQK